MMMTSTKITLRSRENYLGRFVRCGANEMKQPIRVRQMLDHVGGDDQVILTVDSERRVLQVACNPASHGVQCLALFDSRCDINTGDVVAMGPHVVNQLCRQTTSDIEHRFDSVTPSDLASIFVNLNLIHAGILGRVAINLRTVVFDVSRLNEVGIQGGEGSAQYSPTEQPIKNNDEVVSATDESTVSLTPDDQQRTGAVSTHLA